VALAPATGAIPANTVGTVVYPLDDEIIPALNPWCGAKETSHPPPELPHLFAPAFQCLFDQRHELIGDGAIDEAMIVAQSQMNN
jgi:hypothetical protein